MSRTTLFTRKVTPVRNNISRVDRDTTINRGRVGIHFEDQGRDQSRGATISQARFVAIRNKGSPHRRQKRQSEFHQISSLAEHEQIFSRKHKIGDL